MCPHAAGYSKHSIVKWTHRLGRSCETRKRQGREAGHEKAGACQRARYFHNQATTHEGVDYMGSLNVDDGTLGRVFSTHGANAPSTPGDSLCVILWGRSRIPTHVRI